MRRTAAFAAAALAWGIAVTTAMYAAGTPARVPVLVELFTSEGCFDCPPADTVLATLATQPVPGAEVIALGEHVDYWDKQGWKDPFSSSLFTSRQVEYARALSIDSPYTPQMIVNGRDEFVGSNYAAASAAVAKATRAPRPLGVTIELAAASSGTMPVRIGVRAAEGTTHRAADLFLAVTEDNLDSNVERGENRGKHLHHVAVVRSLSRVGAWDGMTPAWSAAGSVRLEPGWKPAAVKIVAFLQDHASRAILGAASTPLR